MVNVNANANRENLGPAERIIGAVLAYTDHLYHGRPGVVVPDARTNVGVRWEKATYKLEDVNGTPRKVVYLERKAGKKTTRTRFGVITEAVGAGGHVIQHVRTDASPNHPILGEYRSSGIFPEVAVWMYRQVAEVWKLDNEFAARWASYAFGQEHRDLKVVLAAFMLVQSRKGDPVRDGGEIVFRDEDYRNVGEAMTLMRRKDDKDFDPKMLLRVHDVLTLPQIADINRELGFGKSPRNPFLGRWPDVVEKWLRHREENPQMLTALVKGGWRSSVIELARLIGYKPDAPRFFHELRWKQAQAKDGRRSLMIGVELEKQATLEGKTEPEICEWIMAEKPNWKRIVGMLPREIGVTRAVVAAAIEAGGLSDKDIVIAAPTLEELGLHTIPAIATRLEAALKNADDTRAANVARNIQNKELREKMVEAADTANKKAVETVIKNMRVYWFIDISGSMSGSIEAAKVYIAKALPGFPLEQTHVATFNTVGREVVLKHASAKGVEQAFKGIAASGGTAHGMGVHALAHHKPKDDEDVLFIFVGDEAESSRGTFETVVQASGLRPMAFAVLRVPGEPGDSVRQTARKLNIPCFDIDEKIFEDVYAIPRALRNLIAATPVGAAARAVAPRMTLVDQILKTQLLKKPGWAWVSTRRNNEKMQEAAQA